MYNKVEICGVNTAKLKTLTDEEKRELLLRSKNGDNEARQELIDGNLRLVLSIVQRFSNRKENMDDLFQVGCIGLIKAVDNFNTDLNVKFSTYAVPMNVRQRKSLRTASAGFFSAFIVSGKGAVASRRNFDLRQLFDKKERKTNTNYDQTVKKGTQKQGWGKIHPFCVL